VRLWHACCLGSLGHLSLPLQTLMLCFKNTSDAQDFTNGYYFLKKSVILSRLPLKDKTNVKSMLFLFIIKNVWYILHRNSPHVWAFLQNELSKCYSPATINTLIIYLNKPNLRLFQHFHWSCRYVNTLCIIRDTFPIFFKSFVPFKNSKDCRESRHGQFQGNILSAQRDWEKPRTF